MLNDCGCDSPLLNIETVENIEKANTILNKIDEKRIRKMNKVWGEHHTFTFSPESIEHFMSKGVKLGEVFTIDGLFTKYPKNQLEETMLKCGEYIQQLQDYKIIITEDGDDYKVVEC